MTLLYVEGFEGFDSSGNRTALDPNYDFSTGTGTGEAGLFTPGRLSGRAAFNESTTTAQEYMSLPVGGLSSEDDWIVGMAFKVNGTEFSQHGGSDFRPAIISFHDSDGDEQFRIYARSGTLNARVGQSGTLFGTADLSINAKVWYFLEVKVNFHASTGSIVARIHEQEVLNLTNINTASTTSGQTRPYEIRFANENGARLEIDDIYICDDVDATGTQGAAYNDFLGDNIVVRLTPNANGTTNDFTGSDADSTDNYLLVDDDPPDGDTTYVQSATVGQKDLYGFEALSLTPAQIEAVVLKSYAKKTDGGSRTFVHVARSSASETDSDAIAPSTDYQFHQSIFTLDPNTSARWLKAGVDAMEGGVKVAS